MEKDKQKQLVSFFKQFVTTALFKHFRASEEALNEWNYFSSLLSQENIDIEKLKLYLEVLSKNEEPYSPSKTQYLAAKKIQEEEKKTNSGIYSKKQEGVSEAQKMQLQLNKTMGGNTDRIKFTGMLSQKSNPYTFQSKQKKKAAGKSVNVNFLIDGMSILVNSMSETHNKLQMKGNRTDSNQGSMNGNFYRYKAEQRF